MADGIIIDYSTKVWEQKFVEWLAATGKRLIEGLEEEWPLLMRKIIDFTPPFKSGGASGVSDYSVGRQAVAGDIYKTMRPFDPSAVRSKSLQKIVNDKNYAAFNIVADRSASGYMKGSVAAPFSPDIHTRQRDARGRVSHRTVPFVMLGSDAAMLKKYVREVQDHVGYARSGWVAAYNLVKDPEGYALPNWVAKHGENAGGVIDERGATDPSFTARNWSPWAGQPGEKDRIITDAYGSRAFALVSKIQTKLRLAAQDANLEVNAA